MARLLLALLLAALLGGCVSGAEPQPPVAKSPSQVDANPMIPPGAKDAARQAVGGQARP